MVKTGSLFSQILSLVDREVFGRIVRNLKAADAAERTPARVNGPWLQRWRAKRCDKPIAGFPTVPILAGLRQTLDRTWEELLNSLLK